MKRFLTLTPFVIVVVCLVALNLSRSKGRQYATLVATATQHQQQNQALLENEFKLGTYHNFDYSQKTGQLTFSNASGPKVVADVQFVGDYSEKSRTWLWGWANKSILPSMKTAVETVHNYGIARGYRQLTTASWPASMEDCWKATAVSAELLNAKGMYRGESRNGYVFMVITRIRSANR